MTFRRFAVAAAVVAVAGCAYTGTPESVDLPTQRATFFSYLEGEDIRASCGSNAEDRYRMVYNANFNDQVRGYDVEPTTGGGGVLRQIVDRGITFDRSIDLTRPQTIGAPAVASTPLSAEDMEHLGALLRASGAFEAPPVGLRLRALEHFWVVSGCHGGDYFLTAYRYPSVRYDRISFIEFLRAHDRTGVRFPSPSRPSRNALVQCPQAWRSGDICFTQQVGASGLVGDQSLF